MLRTADATTPFLTTPQVATSLAVFALVYTLIFSFGVVYIYRLLRAGPATVQPPLPAAGTNPKRPLSLGGSTLDANPAPEAGQ